MNGYATLYHPYTQNCCIDPARNNKGARYEPICEIESGDTSCCNPDLKSHRRRRHGHHMHRVSGLVMTNGTTAGDGSWDDYEDEGDNVDDVLGAGMDDDQ